MPPQVAIAIAVVERDDRFLVGVRTEGHLAGCCEFPGGKVEEGETPAEAAARECLEETGIRVSIGPLVCRTRHDYEHGALELFFFAAAVMDGQASEGQASPQAPFRWAARQELPTLRFPPANAEILALLREPKPRLARSSNGGAREEARRKEGDCGG